MKNNKYSPYIWVKVALGISFFILLGVFFRPYFAGSTSISPIAFSFGSISVHWYGVIMASAIVLSGLFAVHFNRDKQAFTVDDLLSAATWATIGGLIGARLLFVFLKWPLYQANLSEILYIQNGGLSIHGALLGGAISLYIYCRIQGKSFLRLADLFALVIPVGQMVGRLGNFINQEAYGGPTNLPWKMFVAETNRPLGLEEYQYFHPTFLYEGLGSLIIFFVLARLYKRSSLSGETLVAYLIMYSGLRFRFMLFFRF